MSKKILLPVLISIIVVIFIFGIGLIVGYNNLVDLDENINSKYGQIEVRLQERHDKIGQIVSVVQGLQEHALSIYNAITSAREAYTNAVAANDIDAMISADAAEAIALTNLLAVVEDNPDISAVGGYYALIDEVSSIESALAVARRDYNNAVQAYNAAVRKFPRVLYASIFGFEKDLPYWKMNDGADEVPEIVFTD